MPYKTHSQVAKEFDEKGLNKGICHSCGTPIMMLPVLEIKAFLSRIERERLSALIEHLEGMIKEVPPNEEVALNSLEILGGETTESRATWMAKVSSNYGFNTALSDILSYIKSLQDNG